MKNVCNLENTHMNKVVEKKYNMTIEIMMRTLLEKFLVLLLAQELYLLRRYHVEIARPTQLNALSIESNKLYLCLQQVKMQGSKEGRKGQLTIFVFLRKDGAAKSS